MTFSRVMLFIAAMVVAVAIGLTVNKLVLDNNGDGPRTIGVAASHASRETVHKEYARTTTCFHGDFLPRFAGTHLC